MDRAFDSRIHISLTYPKLGHQERHKVWKNFIRSLHVDTSGIGDAQIDDFATLELNGRQIKNVVKMAYLLAAAEEGVLKPMHVEMIMGLGKTDKLGQGGE
jgi:hypothetical protein